MLDRSEVGKRGYLNEEFRLFHLKDSRAQKEDNRCVLPFNRIQIDLRFHGFILFHRNLFHKPPGGMEKQQPQPNGCGFLQIC